MAFSALNFQPIGGQSKRGIGVGGAPAMWSYKTADTHATVDTVGYFQAVRDLLNIGDVILVTVVTNLGASNEALATAGWHVVKDKPAAASGIDVTDVTALTVTDTD